MCKSLGLLSAFVFVQAHGWGEGFIKITVLTSILRKLRTMVGSKIKIIAMKAECAETTSPNECRLPNYALQLAADPRFDLFLISAMFASSYFYVPKYHFFFSNIKFIFPYFLLNCCVEQFKANTKRNNQM